MGEGYWRRCYDMKKEVVRKIQEVLGDNVIDVEDQEMVVVAVERHCGEPMEGKVTKVSEDGFWLDIDPIDNFCWAEMMLEDLCCLLDFLIGYK